MPAATHARSGRAVRLTQHYTDSLSQKVLMDQNESEKVPTAEMQYQLQQATAGLTAFTASANPDVLYIHEVMKVPDRDKFIDAMGAKLKGHKDMGNFVPIPLTHVPKVTKLIDMVWSMCRK